MVPACWQNLKETEWHTLCKLMDTFEGSWCKSNLIEVMKLGYVKFDDISKLQGCHMVSKEDPLVFKDPVVDKT